MIYSTVNSRVTGMLCSVVYLFASTFLLVHHKLFDQVFFARLLVVGSKNGTYICNFGSAKLQSHPLYFGLFWGHTQGCPGLLLTLNSGVTLGGLGGPV